MAIPDSIAASGSLSDEAARQRIGPWQEAGQPDLGVFAPDVTFVVRAAAGSGKTTALVARMVALVRKGVPIEELAAITFTRKAAGEMNERLFKELRRARRELREGSDEQEAVQEAIAKLPRCFIGTVHAFCARILRQHALAAGLPPRFQAGIDERDERELRERALETYLQEAYRERRDELDALHEWGVAVEELGPFFQRLCRFPDLEPYTDGPDEAPAMEAAVEEGAALLKQWQAQRPQPLPKGRDGAMKQFDRAEKLLAYDRVETPAEQAAFLKCFEQAAKGIKVTYWGKKDTNSRTAADAIKKETLPHFLEHTVRPRLRHWAAFVHGKVTAFLWPAVARYRRERRERGLLTHQDLLFFTRELLRDHPDVRRRVQERYPRILVDEFQDTDPLQAEILFYLAGDDPEEKDWRACTPRPGSLFIVGDDKQSIYRFRRADKAVFDEVAERVSACKSGAMVDLTRNFRSLGSICSWCNDAFEALFNEPALADVQAEYVPLQAHRPEGEDPCGLRRIDVEKVKGNWGKEIAKKDAARIAGFIQAACSGKHPDLVGGGGAIAEEAVTYSDFLLLTRTKSRLNTYTDALAAHGIPFDVTGSEDLGQSRELRSLTQLLRTALRPDDPIAAVAYLRGGACGFSDADLYAFKKAGGQFDQMATGPSPEVMARLPDALEERFETALQRVRRARERLVSTRPTLAIEEIARDTGLVAGAVHPEAPEEASLRGGQLLRGLTYVRHLAEQGMGWGEITEELQRVVDGEEKIDSMTLQEGRGEAVRVMNVHQAKGLEAPVVFLADPYSRGGSSHEPELHVRRQAGEVVLPMVRGEGYTQTLGPAPLGWHEDSEHAFQAEEARREEAEHRRLLYVAATRAENMLVVSTYAPKEGEGYWGALHAALEQAEVPVLSQPGSSGRAGPQRAARAPRLKAEAAKRNERVRRCSAPSYRLRAVTDEKEEHRKNGTSHFGNGTGFEDEAEGYGASFGTAMHALFELLAQERTASMEEGLAGAVLRRHLDAPSEGEIARAEEMAQGLLESELWSEVLSARRVFTEYPVARRSDAEAFAEESDTTRTSVDVERGTIDLLYERTNGGWGLVDFKTIRLPEGKPPELPPDHPYHRQMRCYAEAWARVAGTPPVFQALWFADADVPLVVADAGEKQSA